MQAVVRRHQQHFPLPLVVARRWFADRGSTRRDFTDPNFQTQGYINPSCYASTQPGRLSPPKDFTHSPVYAGLHREEQGYRMNSNKLGAAKGGLEEEETTEEQEENNHNMRKTVLPTQDSLSFPKRKAARLLFRKKRARSEFIKDYSSFRYEGSGLDEYTVWLEKKEERRRKRSGDEPF